MLLLVAARLAAGFFIFYFAAAQPTPHTRARACASLIGMCRARGEGAGSIHLQSAASRVPRPMLLIKGTNRQKPMFKRRALPLRPSE
jgi:hypothetical protein